MTSICKVCSKEFATDHRSQKFCSPACYAKSQAHPLADEVKIAAMYASGKTQVEIALTLSISQKSVLKALRRAGVQCRRAIKRNQLRERNAYWAGDKVKYSPAHDRVRRERGWPQRCEFCGVSRGDRKLEWANKTGKYHDPNDYLALCISCHRSWDAKRRKERRTHVSV